MSDTNRQSWDEAIDALRRAASEVNSAVGRGAASSGEEDAAAARLKADVSRLEQAASDVRAKFSGSIEQERENLESSFERERAKQTADQIRGSLEELATIAGRLTTDVAAAASTSVRNADPELKSAIRALEDVAGSAAAWVRTVIDPSDGKPSGRSSAARPPLDEM